MFFRKRHLQKKEAAQHELELMGKGRLRFTSENKFVRIRYIVDYFPRGPGLRGEIGVSYLIQTESCNVLFDLGLNQRKETPSALASNLREMKLEHQRLDGIVISHNHQDHVGGLKSQRRRTPAVDQILPECREGATIWTPVRMNVDSMKAVTVSGPMELLPGLGTTGPLPAHMYFLGDVKEQALLLPVAGKGLVLVTGCGHPGAVEMIRLAKSITGMNVFAVVGGLHLMFSAGRSLVQQILGSTDAPWAGLKEGDIRLIAKELLDLGVREIAPSAHDTCDAGLQILREAFSEGYLEVKAGGEHVFGNV